MATDHPPAKRSSSPTNGRLGSVRGRTPSLSQIYHRTRRYTGLLRPHRQCEIAVSACTAVSACSRRFRGKRSPYSTHGQSDCECRQGVHASSKTERVKPHRRYASNTPALDCGSRAVTGPCGEIVATEHGKATPENTRSCDQLRRRAPPRVAHNSTAVCKCVSQKRMRRRISSKENRVSALRGMNVYIMHERREKERRTLAERTRVRRSIVPIAIEEESHGSGQPLGNTSTTQRANL